MVICEMNLLFVQIKYHKKIKVCIFFPSNQDTQGYEVRVNIGNVTDSYSGADRFESRPSHCYTDDIVFPCLFICFLPTPLHFSIQQ
jgi:hypothetical protein